MGFFFEILIEPCFKIVKSFCIVYRGGSKADCCPRSALRIREKENRVLFFDDQNKISVV